MSQIMTHNMDNMDTISNLSESDNETSVGLIYRYKFTQDYMDILHQFSKIHQYDDRKTFKEAWLEWTKVNNEEVTQEINRLTNLGYDGDIMDKMFKSARYYFRKKSNLRPEPKERKQYISINKNLLDAFDLHIINNSGNINYTPALGFINFCSTHISLLKTEIIHLMNNKHITDYQIIHDKIKKTYKNRYFMINKK